MVNSIFKVNEYIHFPLLFSKLDSEFKKWLLKKKDFPIKYVLSKQLFILIGSSRETSECPSKQMIKQTDFKCLHSGCKLIKITFNWIFFQRICAEITYLLKFNTIVKKTDNNFSYLLGNHAILWLCSKCIFWVVWRYIKYSQKLTYFSIYVITQKN